LTADPIDEWIASAELRPDPARGTLRAGAVRSFAQTAHLGVGLDLLRVVAGLPPHEVGLVKRLRDEIRSADATFPEAGNDFELRMMAGASLCAILTRKDPAAHGVSLALEVLTDSTAPLDPALSRLRRLIPPLPTLFDRVDRESLPQVPSDLGPLKAAYRTAEQSNQLPLIQQSAPPYVQALEKDNQRLTLELESELVELHEWEGFARVLAWVALGANTSGVRYSAMEPAAAATKSGIDLAFVCGAAGTNIDAKALLRAVIGPQADKRVTIEVARAALSQLETERLRQTYEQGTAADIVRVVPELLAQGTIQSTLETTALGFATQIFKEIILLRASGSRGVE
jgi:hypothetical protein